MIFPLQQSVSSVALAARLGVEHRGRAVNITYVASIDELGKGGLGFSTVPRSLGEFPEGIVLIAPPVELDEEANITCLHSDRPRLAFIRVLQWIKFNGGFPSAGAGYVDVTASIHSTAIVEQGAVIGAECRIGPYSHIRGWVTLAEGVTIGSSCMIGHDGFGYELDDYGVPVHFPHLGRVQIDKGVVVGNLCCIARGTLGDTVIASNVKVDDHVYIAHNVRVGESSLLMSGIRLNGRVKIGNNCWIGTGASVREGIIVHSGATLGMGSVVIKNVEPGTTVAGNPAKLITGEKN